MKPLIRMFPHDSADSCVLEQQPASPQVRRSGGGERPSGGRATRRRSADHWLRTVLRTGHGTGIVLGWVDGNG